MKNIVIIIIELISKIILELERRKHVVLFVVRMKQKKTFYSQQIFFCSSLLKNFFLVKTKKKKIYLFNIPIFHDFSKDFSFRTQERINSTDDILWKKCRIYLLFVYIYILNKFYSRIFYFIHSSNGILTIESLILLCKCVWIL